MPRKIELTRKMKDDIRAATRSAMEALAYNTVAELQDAGPYWDGYFANAWVVQEGNVDIPATATGKSYYDLDEDEQRRGPDPDRVYTRPIVPPADLRRGYTIGNEMEYRDIAMDLVPGRLKNGPGTAEQDWYTNLMGSSSPLIRQNKKLVEQTFAKELKNARRNTIRRNRK